MKKILFSTIGLVLFWLLAHGAHSHNKEQAKRLPPLNMVELETELSSVKGCETKEGIWPRVVRYSFKIYDFKTDTFAQEEKTITIKKKPLRIIPHVVGVAEILWAICPKDRLIAFNEFSADPAFSFIADEVRKRGPIFKSNQTELVIGYQPDLVFTVFYSNPDFKEKMKQAQIPYCDLGYFGTIESIKDQILLIGKIIGEEGNAHALVKMIDDKILELKRKLPKLAKPVRVLYYDEGGYVPGISSNFNSICKIISATNVGAEQGIKSWSQIDNETLLKWNPDVIVVPEGSNLKELLMSNKVLSYAQAIKNGKVYYIPKAYLGVESQFMVLSANLLAEIIYAKKS